MEIRRPVLIGYFFSEPARSRASSSSPLRHGFLYLYRPRTVFHRHFWTGTLGLFEVRLPFLVVRRSIDLFRSRTAFSPSLLVWCPCTLMESGFLSSWFGGSIDKFRLDTAFRSLCAVSTSSPPTAPFPLGFEFPPICPVQGLLSPSLLVWHPWTLCSQASFPRGSEVH